MLDLDSLVWHFSLNQKCVLQRERPKKNLDEEEKLHLKWYLGHLPELPFK
jgi:hypothetical protein